MTSSKLDDMTTTTTTSNRTIFRPDPATIRRAINRRSVATLATVSASGRPHAATVLYQCVDDALFVSTFRDSRKARNIADHATVAMTIAVRRLPIGPPASIQFQTAAAVLPNDDPEHRPPRHDRPARPDHRPRRARPRRRLLPAPCPARPRGHLRPRHVPLADHPRPARRRRRDPAALAGRRDAKPPSSLDAGPRRARAT